MVSALTAEAGSISGADTGTMGTIAAHAIPQAAIDKDTMANNFDTLNTPYTAVWTHDFPAILPRIVFGSRERLYRGLSPNAYGP
jgi:hypothetical protein